MNPIDVDDLKMVFGSQVSKLMPPYKDIPDEFKDGRTKFNQFFNDQFFSGVKNVKAVPNEGIDEKKAWRHYRAIACSFEPEHEHKEDACAYLLSQWFSDLTWKKGR